MLRELLLQQNKNVVIQAYTPDGQRFQQLLELPRCVTAGEVPIRDGKQ